MNQLNSGPDGNGLEDLSSLGVQVMDQAVLERTVHDQASRDLTERSIKTEQKRLAKVDSALAKRRQMLARAHETMTKHAPSTARYTSASSRAERLEEEIDQLTDDRNDVVERLAQAQAQMPTMSAKAESVNEAPNIASMIVPQRHAAAMARDAAKSADGDVDDTSGEQGENGATMSESTGDDSDASYHEEEDGLTGSRSDDADLDSGVTSRRRSPNAHQTRATRPGVHDFDDGNEHTYQERVHAWCVARWHARRKLSDSADTAEVGDSCSVWVDDDGTEIPRAALAQEPFLADPGTTDHLIKPHGRGKPPLAVPVQIWDRLLEYQRAALKWMYVLHEQNAGGILGDEMGLGKTVQVAGYLASMYHSKLLSRPSIVVCPATLMRQWVREFHKWWPTLRVVILHGTGYAMQAGSSGMPGEDDADGRLDLSSELMPEVEENIWKDSRSSSGQANTRVSGPAGNDESGSAAGYSSADEYEYDAYGSRIRRKRQIRGATRFNKKQKTAKRKPISMRASRESRRRAEQLVERVHSKGHIVVVTYSGLQVYQDALLSRKWGYAVLDEGHMIRNPDAEVTLACKRLDTRHRILVTGTPIQNNLTELWSLFDFIFPGRLGTLPVFSNQFAVPITVGGYASANSLQVRAGYRCACILRDLIDPYLLRRMKADVAQDLPQKSEQVLFCRLTPMQRAAYTSFLRSSDMDKILSGKLQMLFGVDVARKICDHPDLLLLSTMPTAASTHNEARLKGKDPDDSDVDYEAVAAGVLPADYGDYQKSGKLSIVRALLDMWRPQGHKVLIFSQTRQMLDIIERMLRQLPGCVFRRMDGSTPVQSRATLVDEFNTNPDIFVFLLTTKVGGLGVNLTGADRVILYSPDWNPSSDMQARERAWRLGQTRDVAIYRLMTAGTIEEKIYNRQIYKQFLSNKILSDPNQKRFFQAQSLRDLFSLSGFDTGEEIVAGANASAETRFGRQPDSATGGIQRADNMREATETARMFAGAQLLPKPDDAGESNAHADVNAIGGVVRLEPYRPAQDEESTSAESSDIAGSGSRHGHTPDATANNSGQTSKGSGIEDEDRVLQSLFKMSGMHSALKHDAIVSGKDTDVNHERIEAEAERVASGARMALQESRKARRQLDISVPTWTGSSGEAGMPGGKQRFGSKVNPNLVAPPPSILMSNELPDEFKFGGLQALGGSRPRNLPPAASAINDSIVQNAVTMVRRARIDRALPTGRAVSSLSLHHSIAERRQQHSAPVQDASSRFGSHSVSGMYGGTVPSTSSSLLANLRARSGGMPAEKAGAEPARTPARQVTTALARRSAHEPAVRSPGSRAAVHTNNGWSDSHTSTSRKASAATNKDRGPVTGEELVLVEAIRKALKDAGGEMGSRELIERFERQVPTGGAARLRELAASVADLASRQPQGARRTGIGRVVHKVWVLKGN